MRCSWCALAAMIPLLFLSACVPTGEVVRVHQVSGYQLQGLGENELAQIAEIKNARKNEKDEHGLANVLRGTTNYTLVEYLAHNPDANNPTSQDFSVGGYDVLDIVVYEEPDLSREKVRISADGYISFPLIGRLRLEGLTTSEIGELISEKLSDGQFLIDAHVSVTVREYKSKKFMVLGSVKLPGTYPLQAKERVLDAISKAGGIDFEQGGKEAMIIRTEGQGTGEEEKIVVRIELSELLKGGDQMSNLLLWDNDLLYIPKADSFYIIGQVQKPGSYPYLEKEITLVEAIGKASGFTQIAARNRTRIVRVEDGVEKIIEVQVDKITREGKKGQDVLIRPGDVIVVPESFF